MSKCDDRPFLPEKRAIRVCQFTHSDHDLYAVATTSMIHFPNMWNTISNSLQKFVCRAALDQTLRSPLPTDFTMRLLPPALEGNQICGPKIFVPMRTTLAPSSMATL